MIKDKLIKTITIRHDFDIDCMTFDKLLSEMEVIKKEFPDTFNHTFNIEYPYYGESSIIIVNAGRYETDEEYTKRIETAVRKKITNVAWKKKNKEKTKQKELKQLTKLKEKYER